MTRQKEIQTTNKVLAYLVVILAFTSGYLLAVNQQWLKPYQSKSSQPIEEIALPLGDMLTIKPATPSALINLVKNARYHYGITAKPVSAKHLEKLLWIAQGKITAWGERAVPSHKSLFPIQLYAYARNVNGLSPGLYKFDAKQQILISADQPTKMSIQKAELDLITPPLLLFAVSDKQDGATLLEAGAIAQQVLLGTTELGLTTYQLPRISITPDVISQSPIPLDQIIWIMPIGYPDSITK